MNTLQKYHEMKETKQATQKPTKQKFKTKEKLKAIELYKTGLYTYKEIARIVKVRQNTVSDWVKKYNSKNAVLKNQIQIIVKRLNKEIQSPELNTKAINSLANALKILKNLQE